MTEPRPFKRRDVEKCAACRRGLMHPKNPTGMFWRLRVERLMIDHAAVQRAHGMEAMMGGGQHGAAIAQVLGPDDDLAVTITGPYDVLICEACVFGEDMARLFQVVERAENAQIEEKAEAIKRIQIVNVPVEG